MATLPSTRLAQIEFFESRLSQWNSQALAIGVTPGQITTLTGLVNAARADYEQAQAARNASKAATNDFYITSGSLADFGADLIKTIRAKAQTDNNPAIYSLAQIPPPAAPAPLGAPDAPTGVVGTVESTGAVRVNWKGSLKGGTQFTVSRQLTPLAGSPGMWVVLGSTATREFLDDTVPTGFSAASYRVVAQRSGGASEASEPAVVYFGIAPSDAAEAA